MLTHHFWTCPVLHIFLVGRPDRVNKQHYYRSDILAQTLHILVDFEVLRISGKRPTKRESTIQS